MKSIGILLSTGIPLRPQQFVKTTALEQIKQRSLRYLTAGYCIHLEGPTGTGKTTLAMHLADCRRRRTVLMLGGNQMTGTREYDNAWLVSACCQGWTLVYDEFNRSRPELNAGLLSILEGQMLVLPGHRGPEYLPIHPEFRAIFTSNPEEYCGTYSIQGALMDRLITLRVPEPTLLEQQQLLVELFDIAIETATLVIDVVQQFFRQVSLDSNVSVRPSLMIVEVCRHQKIQIALENDEFRQVCRDILLARSAQSAIDANEVLWAVFNRLSNCGLMTQTAMTPSPLSYVGAP